MADKFLQNEGIEVGYFAKRQDQFVNEINKGLKTATGQPAKAQIKKKTTPAPKMVKQDIVDKKPSELKGKEFAERMRLAREAKAKERVDK